MRILFVSTSSGSRGGGELSLVYLGRALAERGHTVGLWCARHPRMDELAAQFAPFGTVLRAPYTNTYDRRLRSLSDLVPRSRPAYRQQWASFQPDAIQLNKQNLEDGLDLLRAADRMEIPGIAAIHITHPAASLGAFLGRGRDWIARRALARFAGTLVAISPTRRQQLQAFLGRYDRQSARVTCIDNGVYVPSEAERQAKRGEARSWLGLDKHELLFIAVGRMEPQKRPLLFLQWAQALKQHLPQAHFCWIGEGSYCARWDRWVEAQQAGGYIRRWEWQQDVTPFLAAADGFLHPAQFEGLPFALLEAMAWRLPCAIASSLAAELQLPAGSYFSVSDDRDGQHAGLAQMAHPAARATAAATGRELAWKQFSIATMAARYEALYRQLL